MAFGRRGLFGLGRQQEDTLTADDLFQEERKEEGVEFDDAFGRYEDNTNHQVRQPEPQRQEQVKSFTEIQNELNQARQEFNELNRKLGDIQNSYASQDENENSRNYAKDSARMRELQMLIPGLERQLASHETVQGQASQKIARYAENFIDAYLTDTRSPISKLPDASKRSIKQKFFDTIEQNDVGNSLINNHENKAYITNTFKRVIELLYGQHSLSNGNPRGSQSGLGDSPNNEPDSREQAFKDQGWQHRHTYPDDRNDEGAMLYDIYNQRKVAKGMSKREYEQHQRSLAAKRNN